MTDINEKPEEHTKSVSCSYDESLFVFFVKNNRKELLKRANKKLSSIFDIKIGIEVESFCTEEYDLLAKSCEIFCKDNEIKILNFTRECVKNQYEIQFDIYENLELLVEHYNKLKSFLINTYNADFRAKPRYFDAGSALQINISLFKNGENVFAEDDASKNTFIQKTVNGLIYYTNYFLPFYIHDNACLDRYSEECNNYIHQKGLISAPSFNSWGINNRTASVRIPDLKNFRDRTNYSQENKKYKRVEFRVPSSNSCIELVLYGVLTSIYIGLRKDIPDVAMTSNNLFVSKHSYENIYIKEFGFREIEEEDDFF